MVQPTPPIIVARGVITAALSKYVESTSSEPFEQFGITGVFARYDIEREDLVENLLGTRVPETELAPDACSSPSPVLDLTIRRAVPGGLNSIETAIDLIDVGDLSVAYRDVPRPIPTRTFPDLLKVIDGVIYTANEAQGVQFMPGETYTLHATGSAGVASFDVVLEAPSDLGTVRVDGIQPEEEIPVIHRGRDLELSWEGTGWGDDVVATLSWTGMGLPWSMVCRMRDDGVFIVPGRLLQGLHDPLAAADEELTLSRIRQVAFRSNGLSSGTFSFVVSNTFPVRIEIGD